MGASSPVRAPLVSSDPQPVWIQDPVHRWVPAPELVAKTYAYLAKARAEVARGELGDNPVAPVPGSDLLALQLRNPAHPWAAQPSRFLVMRPHGFVPPQVRPEAPGGKRKRSPALAVPAVGEPVPSPYPHAWLYDTESQECRAVRVGPRPAPVPWVPGKCGHLGFLRGEQHPSEHDRIWKIITAQPPYGTPGTVPGEGAHRRAFGVKRIARSQVPDTSIFVITPCPHEVAESEDVRYTFGYTDVISAEERRLTDLQMFSDGHCYAPAMLKAWVRTQEQHGRVPVLPSTRRPLTALDHAMLQ